MKYLFFLNCVLLFSISTSTAQIVPRPATTVNPKTPVTPARRPPLPPSVVNGSTTATQNTIVYTLTAVRVNIRTGHDNKEYPSRVITSLVVRGIRNEYNGFVQRNLKNEMRSNSTTEFGLEKITGNLKDITLGILKNNGFQLRIDYSANFQFDAWKIEGVTVVLEFRDQNGNLHPTMGQKIITFTNANGYLNGYPGTRSMTCETDGYFNPLSAFIQ